MLLIDLHTHSDHSDGIPTIQQIEDFCQKKQIGLALTDHNEVRGSLKLFDRGRIPCLPAIEVGTEEGLELLVYFARPEQLEEFYIRAVEPGLRPRFMVRSYIKALECLEAANELGAFVSLAHPYAFGRKSLDFHRDRRGEYKPFVEKVLADIDAVELFNGGVPAAVNLKAESLPHGLSKKITVGSDSHRLATFGAVGVEVDARHDVRSERLFEIVSEGDFIDIRMEIQSSVVLTLPVIGFKHTKFFLTRGSQRRAPVGLNPAPAQ